MRYQQERLTIDIAISASMYVLDGENGANLFSMLMYKIILYILLIYFLLNWGDSVGNLAKKMFTGFGGLIMGASGKEAMQAISDPMDIVSKGVHIIAPIYNELFKIHGVPDLMTKVTLWIPSLFFAVILTICFFAIALQINAKICGKIGGETVAVESSAGGAITSIDQLMAHIRVVESSNRYYVANGGYLESGSVMPNEPHGPAWTPTNQDNVARYILTGYYEKYGSYEMAARCWNQGEGGRLNSDADIYWAKVSGTNPATGGYTAPQVTINMMLLFKVTFVALMFVYMGSRVSKLVIRQFGSGGFQFTTEGV